MSKNTGRFRPVNAFIAEKRGFESYWYKGQPMSKVGHWRSKRSVLKTKVGNDVDFYYVPALKAIAYMWDEDDTRFVLAAPLWNQDKWLRIFRDHKPTWTDKIWLKLHNYQVF